MNSVLTAEHSSDLAVTSFVLTQKTSGSVSRWTAFLFHSTNQFFIKAPFSSNLASKRSLLILLDLAEKLGASEARVCVSRAERNRDALIAELISLGFELLSPRSQPKMEFDILRFDF
jgi:hypothetical protein